VFPYPKTGRGKANQPAMFGRRSLQEGMLCGKKYGETLTARRSKPSQAAWWTVYYSGFTGIQESTGIFFSAKYKEQFEQMTRR
jgi:hypothetical protein